ncbi:hypothetical protein COHA_010452 [Chlorella ohadii]|uniref:Uncharacterized protein n=1 Tax=Chlorella ohadii TaxID=2649997 RepID=A0AAD5DCU4_9CHLO|nr:hypothetical protein COHA_010452 [Chlorella ohadii]
MAGAWNHTLICPAPYLAAKRQCSEDFRWDLNTAECMVAGMEWDAIVALPPRFPDHQPCVRFLQHGSARFFFTAAAGTVKAHSFEVVPTDKRQLPAKL